MSGGTGTPLSTENMYVISDPPTVNLPDNRNDRQKEYTTKLQGQYMLVVDRLLATMAESNLMMA
jgi:hypothetical protein